MDVVESYALARPQCRGRSFAQLFGLEGRVDSLAVFPRHSQLGEPERARPRARTWALLAALTFLVAALHLVGLDWHLPHHPQGDEKVIWLQLQEARGEPLSGDEVLLARCYPPLLGSLAYALIPPAPEPGPNDLDALRDATSHDELWIRAIIAVLSAGIVPTTWLVARRFFADPWALLAAALAATSTIAVWYSSMGRPHAVVTVWTTAAVAASLRARASGRVSDFLLAGSFAALAVGTLHSGLCACAAVAAAWWWNARPRNGAPLVGAIGAAALVIVAVIAFLRGNSLPELEKVSGPLDGVLSFFGMGVHFVNSEYFHGRGFARLVLAMRDYEPILASFALVGIVHVALRVRRERLSAPQRAILWTAGAHPIAHFLVFGAFSNSFQRFWFPVIPALAIAAVYGARTIVATRSDRTRALAYRFVVALIALQVGIALKIAWLRVRDDTYEEAAAWIQEHPERAPFFIEPTVHLPLVPFDPRYRAELMTNRLYYVPWIARTSALGMPELGSLGIDLRELPLSEARKWDQFVRHPQAWIDDLGPGVVVLQVFFDGRRRALAVMREELACRGTALARFDPQPCGAPGSRPIDYLLDGPGAPEAWFAWSILWASRLGPEIEIYRTRG